MPPSFEGPQSARAVVTWLTGQIHAGVWPPESRLPPERRLADQLGVSRSTIAVAYDELQALGLVDRRRGSGTYVHGDLWGLSPDWKRYLEGAAFRPTQSLVQRYRLARQNPSHIDFSMADTGPALWPAGDLTHLLATVPVTADLGYADPRGIPALREAVAAEMTRRIGRPIDSDTVLITTGAQQALYLIVRALLRPGDAVGLERPSFYYSLALFQSAGVRLLPLPMDSEGVIPDGLEAVMRAHRPAMILLNPTYHNPTGITLQASRRQAVKDLTRRWNLPVVEDDAFYHLQVAGTPDPPAPLAGEDTERRVLYVGTLSKIVAPGLRIGWVIAPKPLVDRLADIKGQIDLGVPGLVQRWAALLLTSPEWSRHVKRVQAELRSRREYLELALASFGQQGATWTTPNGGLYVWIRAPEGLPDRARLDHAISAGVVYVPGTVFGAPDGYARINFVAPAREQLQEGLRRLLPVLA